jgi:phage tail P2-like protein
MKTLDDIKLKDTLPESIAKDENVSAAAEALDPQLKLVAEKVDIPALYVNIDNLSSDVLDHLALQYDISVWRDSWPVALKRSVLKTAISDKRKKGTLGAVKKALESLGSAASVVEWWQTNPKGTPHTFTIYATQSKIEGIIDAEMQEDLIAMLDDAKPLRSHYNFVVQTQVNSGIGVYGCLRVVVYRSVRSVESVMVDIEGTVGMVAASRPIIKRHLIATA